MLEARAEPFGRYELLAEIGRGGMAELFLGQLVGIAGFAKPLAIKRILPHLTRDQRFVEMFLNEGRIAAKLSHPNICQVFELGEVNGKLFLAMEYLEGVPWGDLVTTLVASGSVRDPVAILRLAACTIGQACDGLHYAHELHDSQGRPTPVVHRDISPGNLFVTVDGTCKVLDFGVSKIATDQHDTRSGLIKGKLTYMPPEQLKGQDVDARVDVFAMAVVLWEALAGQRLFLRSTDYLIFQAILEEPIPTIGHLFPAALGARVDALLKRGLERDRDRRYPTIRAFADDLRDLVAPLGGVPHPSEIGSLVRDSFEQRLAERSRLVAQLTGVYAADRDGVHADDTAAEPSVTKSVVVRDRSVAVARTSPKRRRGRALAVAALVALAVAAVLVAVLARDDDRRPQVASQPQPVRADAAAPAPPPTPAMEAAPDAGVDEVAIDEIEIDATGSAPQPRVARPRPPVAEPADTRPGFFSVDSNPYATIFIDGKRIDQTPLYRVELPPGRHQVRAVLANGRSRSFTIKIAPGKEVTSGTLRW